MYPYYALFDERRREADEQRFWFWNSMHFPLPMPAFDVAVIDAPYQGIGNWQNRVFAVPPVMGIDYRCVNGYIYISGNPVTDPAKIAERAEFFQRRAGYYFEHWDELYAKWKLKMEALIADLAAIRVPELGEYEPDEVVFDGRSQHGVRRGARRIRAPAALRRPRMAAPQRVPPPRLRDLRDVLRLLQERPPRHPRPAHRPDGRRHRRAALRSGCRAQAPRPSRRRHRRGLGIRRGALADRRSTTSWRRATPARHGSRSSRR